MKNLLKAKRSKFNSKKGFSLVELILAVMILLIVISATVRGLSISYRSAMMGAVKNDAQSVAQRNCDIIMSSIVSIAENRKFTIGTSLTLGDNFINRHPYCEITDNFNNDIERDTDIKFEHNNVPVAYDQTQYLKLKPVTGDQAAVETQKENDKKTPEGKGKKYQYYTIERYDDKLLKDGTTKKYQLYKVTTYVYYTENAFVTCEGEVCVFPQIETTGG